MKGAFLFFFIASSGIYFEDIFIRLDPPTITTESRFCFEGSKTIPLIFAIPSQLTVDDMDTIIVSANEKPIKYLPYKNTNIRFVVESEFTHNEIYIYTRHKQLEPPFTYKLNNFQYQNDTISFVRITVESPKELVNIKFSIPLNKETSGENTTIFCNTYETELPDTVLKIMW